MPPVQDLTTLVNKYKTALNPQQQILDQQIQQNETSGAAQQEGLAAQKTQAFGDIVQGSNDRGGYFSGFSPDQEAKYTAATYLPALAQLQSTIAATRGQILGKKAELDTTANTSAISEQNDQQSAYQKWQMAQEEAARTAAAAQQEQQFKAQQAQLDRNATAASKAPASNIAATVSSIGAFLDSKVGRDGKVSPDTFQAGRTKWVAAGGDPAAYAQAFYKYVNTGQQSKYF